MELAHRGLQEPGESASARGSPGRLEVTRRVGEPPPGCGRPPGGGTTGATAQPSLAKAKKGQERPPPCRLSGLRIASEIRNGRPKPLERERTAPLFRPLQQQSGSPENVCR